MNIFCSVSEGYKVRIHVVCLCALVLGAIFLFPSTTFSQGDSSQLAPTVPSQQGTMQTGTTPAENEEHHRAIQKMEKMANKKREADLKRDTDQLLQLATELKTYVDKNNENVLSLDVVKKADQIEKLAHSVKTKMSAENMSIDGP